MNTLVWVNARNGQESGGLLIDCGTGAVVATLCRAGAGWQSRSFVSFGAWARTVLLRRDRWGTYAGASLAWRGFVIEDRDLDRNNVSQNAALRNGGWGQTLSDP